MFDELKTLNTLEEIVKMAKESNYEYEIHMTKDDTLCLDVWGGPWEYEELEFDLKGNLISTVVHTAY